MYTGCLFCGGDASAPDHWERCDGRQGAIEAEAVIDPADPEITTTTITTPRETSVQAFYNAMETGAIKTRRHWIWLALQELGVSTSGEVNVYLQTQRHIPVKFDSNTHARMTELRDLGLIREMGTRPCRVTKQVCITWAIVPSSEHAGVAIVHRCPLCQQIVSRDVPAPAPNMHNSGSANERGRHA